MKPVWAAPATPITYGLWAWYDMSSASYVTIVGGGITVATDRTGAGRHATQPGAAGLRPTWPGVGINGRSAAEHAGASMQRLGLPSAAALTQGEGFIVVQLQEDPPLAVGNTGLWAFGGSLNNSHVPFIDGTIYEEFGTNARKTTVNPALSLTTPRTYNVWSAPSDFAMNLDGTTIYSTTTNTASFYATPFIGMSDKAGGNVYFNGRWGEFLLYSRKLNDNERDHNNRYLKAKWGL